MKLIKWYLVLLCIPAVVFQSCRKSRSDIGAELFKETRNRVFKKVDSAQYYKVFRQVLEEEKDDIANSTLIQDFYRKNENEPYFVLTFAPKAQLKVMLESYANAPSHGLNPEMFNYSELKPLIEKLYDKKGIKTVEEAYQTIARIELLSANALLKYSTALKYGVVNPRKIFARYYMKTAKPDSAFLNNVLAVKDMSAYLDSIQPKVPQYAELQKALADPAISPSAKRTIALNLERLRWQNKPSADRYVWVNIADYSLKFVDGGKTALTMKVCVGKGPDQELADADYDESEGSVRPHNHTTPQLNSEINNSQVNPIWNIPESIAKNEILKHAADDPYYLVNNNINVYDKSGNVVDADEVDWTGVAPGTYSFKQAPGDDNSLGKIKFQFPNSSSVYLHDTPAQEPFKLDVRAVSHGCVRLEKPLEFARMLYGSDSKKFNLVEKELAESNPTSRDISVSPKVPVYLDYMTCFVDESGKVVIRPDVYKLDNVLSRRMGKGLAF